jgi:ATP-dependent helicase HrpA
MSRTSPKQRSPRAFSASTIALRRARVPQIRYPADLPVVERRDDLLAALRDHQVVVVAGETGSGKTTQLPKLCLELGRGIEGMIGHTQPRRIAARAVAERLAEELGADLTARDGVVGYKVRFTEHGGRDPLIKVMTDGILLAEIQGDPLLKRYDTLIIDEAHERSLTIDFLIGYLRQLLPRRPDLKVVITSATIDPQRFADHFATPERPVPVVEVSGRTYPVEVRYRPLDEAEESDQISAIADSVDELSREPIGDILVFLSGEREIRDTADALKQKVEQTPRLRGTEIVPLYGRLSAAEQHRVFEQHKARRIVLATNVAETSLTVPGIRYVIDPGTARISRYSNRLKVQRLPIEPISQASADQRKGRCGRVADGICIRLYDEDDFEARPRFTDPEIQRTNLASVMLRMASLGLGDVEAFGFLDAPDPRAVKDGVALLTELGAITTPSAGRRGLSLTDVGRQLARLPLDPRWARMVVAADAAGVLADMLVVAAALSIQDPRETPGEKGSAERQKAQRNHARFADESSDFVTLLNLWDHIKEQQKRLSSSAFRRMCRDENLHYLRVREWQDLVTQLRDIAKDMGLAPGPRRDRDAAAIEALHRSLLTGLLSHVGLRTEDRKDHLGARGSRFAVSPGSALFAKPPTWVMAGELVETTRLWGQHCARIDPAWIEPIAEHLVVRTHSEPRWSKSRGSAIATERVTLYGIPIVTERTVTLGRIDPDTARDLFIRHALVLGEWRIPARSPLFEFWRRNAVLMDELTGLEEKARRRDLVIDEESLVDLYAQRLPPSIVSQQHFERWWRNKRKTQPDRLTLTADDLLHRDVNSVGITVDAFPTVWSSGQVEGDLAYVFDPAADDDGVTATIPLSALTTLSQDDLAELVPAHRAELVAALIRALPKPLRRLLVPAPDVAAAVLPELLPEERLEVGLARALSRRAGVTVTADDFDLDKVPAHLRPTFKVVDGDGAEVARGKDLDALKASLAPALQATLSTAASHLELDDVTEFPAEGIPRRFEALHQGRPLVGYPALVATGGAVHLRVLESQHAQTIAHALGVRTLLQQSLTSPVKRLVATLDNRTKIALGSGPEDSVPAMLDEVVAVAIDDLVRQAGGPPWTAADFDAVRDHVRAHLYATTEGAIVSVARTLESASEVSRSIAAIKPSKPLDPVVADLKLQLDDLIHPGFVLDTGWPRLSELPRYLGAMLQRLERVGGRLDRDLADMLMVQQLQDDWLNLAERTSLASPPPGPLTDIRWQLEELRVSVFASTLKAKGPVSEKRVLAALAGAADSSPH